MIKCKDCGKAFNNLTKSSLSNTKLPLEKWIEYAKYMVLGYSIRECAKIVNVCVKTSFFCLTCIKEHVIIFYIYKGSEFYEKNKANYLLGAVDII